MGIQYDDFHLHLSKQGQELVVKVRCSFGECEERLPLSDLNYVLPTPIVSDFHPGRDYIREMGALMAACLFPRTIRTLFAGSSSNLPPERGLRIVIECEDSELHNLPWEMSVHPINQHQFLCTDPRYPMVRYVALPEQRGGGVQVRPPLRLLLVKGPADDLELDAEVSRLLSALGTHLKAGTVEYHLAERPSLGGLQDLLEDVQPHVLHFMGHGCYDAASDQSYLHLVDDYGDPYDVEAERLSHLLRGTSVKLVVLNACETGVEATSRKLGGLAPALARAGVCAVVAHQYAVPDPTAIALAGKFYHNLLRGARSIEEALSSARKSLLVADLDGISWTIPVLFLRGPGSFTLTVEGESPLTIPSQANPTNNAPDLLAALKAAVVEAIAESNQAPLPSVEEAAREFEEGRPERALAILSAVLDANPLNVAAWVHKAQCHYDVAQYHEALHAINEAQGLHDTLAVRSIRACILAEMVCSGQAEAFVLSEAVSIFQEITERFPEEPESWYNLGNTLDAAGMIEQAISAFNRCLELNPDHACAWKNKGTALYKLKRHEEELACYDRALNLVPNLPEGLSSKAATLSYVFRRHDEAITLYRRILETNHGFVRRHPNVLHSLAYCYANVDRFEEALAALDQCLSMNPGVTQALNLKGSVLSHLWRTDKDYLPIAKRFFETLTIGSYAEIALAELVQLCLATNQYADATEFGRKAIEKGFSSPSMLAGLGHAYQHLGNHSEAVSFLRQASNQDDCFASWYASALLEAGNISEAALEFEKALKHSGDDPKAWFEYGVTLDRLKRDKEAFEAFTQSLMLDDLSAAAWLNVLIVSLRLLQPELRTFMILDSLARHVQDLNEEVARHKVVKQIWEELKQRKKEEFLPFRPGELEPLGPYGALEILIRAIGGNAEVTTLASSTRPVTIPNWALSIEAMLRADSLRGEQRLEEALDAALEALEVAQGVACDYYRVQAMQLAADLYLSHKEPENALPLIENALNFVPREAHQDRAGLEYDRAICFLSLQRWQDCKLAAESALELGLPPAISNEAIRCRGFSLLQIGFPGQAILDLATAEKETTADDHARLVPTLRAKAWALFHLGDPLAAIRELASALKKSEDDHLAQIQLREDLVDMALQAGQFDLAAQLSSGVLTTLTPDHRYYPAGLYLKMAVCVDALGLTDVALDYYEMTLHLMEMPHNAIATALGEVAEHHALPEGTTADSLTPPAYIEGAAVVKERINQIKSGSGAQSPLVEWAKDNWSCQEARLTPRTLSAKSPEDLDECYARLRVPSLAPKLEAVRVITESFESIADKDAAWQNISSLVQDSMPLVRLILPATIAVLMSKWSEPMRFQNVVSSLLQDRDANVRNAAVVPATFLLHCRDTQQFMIHSVKYATKTRTFNSQALQLLACSLYAAEEDGAVVLRWLDQVWRHHDDDQVVSVLHSLEQVPWKAPEDLKRALGLAKRLGRRPRAACEAKITTAVLLHARGKQTEARELLVQICKEFPKQSRAKGVLEGLFGTQAVNDGEEHE